MSKAPKNASTCLFANNIKKFLWQFPDLKYNGKEVVCLVCDKSLLCWKPYMCRKHVNSATHKLNKTGERPYNAFLFDLTLVLSACNIPVEKIGLKTYHEFWKKYNPTWKLPSLSTLRRYLPSAREKIENSMKTRIKSKRLWLTIGVTTDIKKNSIASILVRILNSQGPSQPYLLACKRLQRCTDEAICNILVGTLQNFEILPEQMLMIVTDADSAMLRGAHLFKHVCPNLLHVTCLLHALHLAADTIRKSYPDVDKLITQTKAVFLKSPKQVRLFHSQCPDIPEPPRPILTRWGTWLETAFYYFQHFEKIKLLILQLDAKKAVAIKQSEMPFQNHQVAADLKIIYDNYVPIADALKKLQNTSLSLQESLEIVTNVETVLHALNDEKSVRVREKFNAVLHKNLDFTGLRQIYNNGPRTDPFIKFKDYFNYANITSLDVERSFSAYKQIFTPQRTNLKETSVETYVMLQVFSHAHPDFFIDLKQDVKHIA